MRSFPSQSKHYVRTQIVPQLSFLISLLDSQKLAQLFELSLQFPAIWLLLKGYVLWEDAEVPWGIPTCVVTTNQTHMQPGMGIEPV